MGDVLRVLGLALLVVLVAGAVAVVWLVVRFRRVLRQLGAAVATPSRISLTPIPRPEWAASGKSGDDVETFRREGFEEVGAFAVPELADVELVAFVHPTERMYGVTCVHSAAGAWSDLVILYEDGRTHDVSSAPSGGELDEPPWVERRWEKGAPASRLLELLRASAPAEGRKAVDETRFVADFTGEYARGMAWRNERGGPTHDEVRRVSEEMGLKLSEEQIDAGYAALRRQTTDRLAEECVTRFLATTELGDEHEFRERPEYLVAIHEQTTAEGAADVVLGVAELPVERVAVLDRAPPPGRGGREHFTALVQELPEGLRPLFLGTVEEPVPADVWLLPEPPGDPGP